MNWSLVVQLIAGLLGLVPQIMSAWNSSPQKGLAGVGRVIVNTPIVPQLTELGSTLFPKLSPELHAAAAALIVAHPDNTSWVQSAINVLASTGYVVLTAQLAVDGIYGPKTKAAVELVQEKLGLPTTGFVADIEYNAIAALLSKA